MAGVAVDADAVEACNCAVGDDEGATGTCVTGEGAVGDDEDATATCVAGEEGANDD